MRTRHPWIWVPLLVQQKTQLHPLLLTPPLQTHLSKMELELVFTIIIWWTVYRRAQSRFPRFRMCIPTRSRVYALSLQKAICFLSLNCPLRIGTVNHNSIKSDLCTTRLPSSMFVHCSAVVSFCCLYQRRAWSAIMHRETPVAEYSAYMNLETLS